MTVVVCDRYGMAADSQANINGSRCTVRKIQRVRGALIGVSGDAQDAVKFWHWYANGAPLWDRPRGLNIGALVLDHSGIYRYEGECYPYEILQDYAAAGSGADAAKGALLAGATLRRAAEIATAVDINTGLPVHYLRLNTEEGA